MDKKILSDKFEEAEVLRMLVSSLDEAAGSNILDKHEAKKILEKFINQSSFGIGGESNAS